MGKTISDKDPWPLLDQIAYHVEGGCSDPLDQIIELLTGEDLGTLPVSTLEEIDQAFFTCSDCDWTYPVDNLGESPGEITQAVCKDCLEE